MRKEGLFLWLSGALAAAAMAAAVTAPAEVVDNLEFFSDFELLYNLEMLEDEPRETGLTAVSTFTAVSAFTAVSTAAKAVPISTGTVKISTSARRAL